MKFARAQSIRKLRALSEPLMLEDPDGVDLREIKPRYTESGSFIVPSIAAAAAASGSLPSGAAQPPPATRPDAASPMSGILEGSFAGLKPARRRSVAPEGDALLEKWNRENWKCMERVWRYRRPQESADDAVASEEITFRFFREYVKVRNFRMLPVFALCFVSLCFIAFANRVDFDAAHSSYFAQQGLRQMMRAEDFLNVDDWGEYYAWLHKAVDNVFARTPGNPTSPLGFVLVRQLRSQRRMCQMPAAFTMLSQGSCPAGSFDTSPFPNTVPAAERWLPNTLSPQAVYAEDYHATWFGLRYPDFQYVQPLYFNLGGDNVSVATSNIPAALVPVGVAEAHAMVNRMQRLGFLDEQTLTVGVDLAVFHTSTKRYSRCCYLMEQLPSGVLQPSVQGNTFKAQGVGGTVANITLASDIFVLLFLIMQIFDLVTWIWARYHFTRSLSQALFQSMFQWLTLLLIFMLGATVGYRFEAWST